MQTNNHLLSPKGKPGNASIQQNSKPQIMVIDNQTVPADSHPLCRPLLQCGYQVTHLVNPQEALSHLSFALNKLPQAVPALIICDLFLRGMDGLDFVQDLRHLQNACNQNIPILLVATIESNPTFEQAVVEMGADDFIVKPVRASDLILRVRRLMRGMPGMVKEHLESVRLENRRGRELEAYPLDEGDPPFRGIRRNDFDFE